MGVCGGAHLGRGHGCHVQWAAGGKSPLASSCTALPRPQRTPDFALGADHICWLEGSGAILAEVVCVVVVFRGSKHGENLVNLGGEEVLWEKQLQEVEDMLKGSLGEWEVMMRTKAQAQQGWVGDHREEGGAAAAAA